MRFDKPIEQMSDDELLIALETMRAERQELAMEDHHDLRNAEKRWERLARMKNYQCSICSQLIPYGEQVVFFDRGLCSWCAYMADKDD